MADFPTGKPSGIDKCRIINTQSMWVAITEVEHTNLFAGVKNIPDLLRHRLEKRCRRMSFEWINADLSLLTDRRKHGHDRIFLRDDNRFLPLICPEITIEPVVLCNVT